MLRFARREPSAVLLAAQLAGVLLYPFMEASDVGRSLFSVFARSLSMLEQLAGLAYVAMVVSRLVGIMVTRRADPR